MTDAEALVGCDAHRVDWRARALDAEAALATVAELAHLQAPIIERVTERVTIAESIARRALVEGLKECERLRALLLAVFPPDRHIGGEPYWFIGGYRLRIRDGHPFHTFYPLDEQAIRTDAARAERERIVADARTAAAHARQEDGGAVSTAAETLEEFADWLERGDHAKGGG